MFDLYLKTANKEEMDLFLSTVEQEWVAKNLNSFQEAATVYEIGYLQRQIGAFQDPEQGIVPIYEDQVEKGWLVNIRTLEPAIAEAVQLYAINPSTPQTAWL